ncbi:O-antigen/teichoic acid export membrane protein [Flavobacterium sp. 270]|uniref:flippase n=1 Tax=Flavobacterium sp. 270 TaxID=2512114 RepID=UPI001064825C|nr:flippase [Flavobacterium sp. 270]TDW47116.1 O-antigen/teichoic acid export membrane protein [Flavobacterium sp. 270]
MNDKSIRYNYFLNVSRIGFGILVGLFTMPYVNRAIGVESLGKIEYVNSIIAYFVLFSALGIPMYGIRETANKGKDIAARTKLVLELLCILLITSIISYVVLFLYVINIDSLQHLKLLIVIMSSSIFFSNIGIEWFYQGIEDQKYITIRFFVVRIVSLILLFLFVKSPNDYINYGIIVVLSTVGGNIFNILYLRKHLDLKGIKFKDLNLKKHFKPVLTIFIASISVSIYVQLDILLLGSLKGNQAVGYYAMANKLVRFVVILITTLGTVLLPRLSYLINNDKDQYLIYIKKSLNYFLIIAFPFSILFFTLAKDFTLLMGGISFAPSILTMKILSPIIVIVSIAYFIGYLVLYPQGKENIYTIAVILSAVLSVVANFFLIPIMGHIGAAIVAVLSELLGIIIMIIFYYKELSKLKLLNISLLYYIISSTLMFLIISLISYLGLSPFINLVISSASGFLTFYLFLYLIKEEIVSSVICDLRSKFIKL